MRAVRFVRTVMPYAAGEVAGFPVEQSRKFVESGAAEWYAEEAVGDGSGGALPDLPESAYAEDAKPLDPPAKRPYNRKPKG